MKPPRFHFGLPFRAASIWSNLETVGVTDVVGVWQHVAQLMTVVALKQRYAGHAKRAGLIAAANSYMGRLVVVVDDDVDPSNLADVMWAITTRCEPAEQIDIVRNAWSSALDPRIPDEHKRAGITSHSKAIIEAVRPFGWKDKFPPTSALTADEAREIEVKWGGAIAGRKAPAAKREAQAPLSRRLLGLDVHCARRRLVLAEIHIDLHPGGERAGLRELHHDLHRIDIGRGCSSRARSSRDGSTSGAIDVTVPANSLPGNAAARTDAACPTLISAISRSSSSARTFSVERLAIDSSGCSADGAASSPGLMLICSTVPSIGARIFSFSRLTRASARSPRAEVVCASFGVGSGASMPRSCAWRLASSSWARTSAARALVSVGGRRAARPPLRRGLVDRGLRVEHRGLGLGHRVLGAAALQRLAGDRLLVAQAAGACRPAPPPPHSAPGFRRR